MVQQPVLTDNEWRLILELLEREERELPSEIRHTTTFEMRDQLRGRLGTVRKLVEHLKQIVQPAPADKSTAPCLQNS